MIANIRRAALTLHGVSTKDKAWIMARLPEDVRLELDSCLSELDQLGIRSTDMAGVDSIQIRPSTCGASTPFDVAMQTSKRDSLINSIEAHSFHELLAWANSEAEWVAAQILLLLNDSLTIRILENIQIDKAARIRKLQSEITALTPALGDLLLKRLDEELHEIPLAQQGRKNLIQEAAKGSRISIRERLSKWFRSFDQYK